MVLQVCCTALSCPRVGKSKKHANNFKVYQIIFRLKTDMQDQADTPLIDTEDKISFCLSNLMLTGTAVPYLHNGIMSADENDATNFEVRYRVSQNKFYETPCINLLT